MRLKEVIIVEGNYDKIRVKQAFKDAAVITTNGFRLYKDKAKIEMIRQLAQTNGIIILTDSDSAGLKIRNFIKNCLGCSEAVKIKHAYIPQIKGKERRKVRPGAEGYLGVEGMEVSAIINAVSSVADAKEDAKSNKNKSRLTKTDFFELGLSGHKDSRKKRAELCDKLNLPTNLSANSFLEVLNSLYTRDRIIELFRDSTLSPLEEVNVCCD